MILNNKNEIFLGYAWKDITKSPNHHRIRTYRVYINDNGEIKIYNERIVKFGNNSNDKNIYVGYIHCTHQHISFYLNQKEENVVLSRKRE